MKPTIKKILYATDLSKNSAFAFQYAACLEEKYEAKIIIVHVFEEWSATARAAAAAYLTEEHHKKISYHKPDIIEKIRNRLKVFCENVQEDDPECVYRVENIEVSEGLAAEVILEKTDEFDSDVIVMGTHEKGIMKHAFLGSVAEKVLHHSKIPVFTIPLPKKETDITVRDF